MTDRINRSKRSWNMSRIRSKDTKPEFIVRSILHRAGFRFRLHDPQIPGKPDIVLPKYKTVIFVHGCFWHRHENCKNASTPSTRKLFWENKFAQNVKRDKEVHEALEKMGWKKITIWECTVMKTPEKIIDIISSQLGIDFDTSIKLPERKELLKVAEDRFNKYLNK